MVIINCTITAFTYYLSNFQGSLMDSNDNERVQVNGESHGNCTYKLPYLTFQQKPSFWPGYVPHFFQFNMKAIVTLGAWRLNALVTKISLQTKIFGKTKIFVNKKILYSFYLCYLEILKKLDFYCFGMCSL